MRIHGLGAGVPAASSTKHQSSGRHDKFAASAARSGCGIIIVKRPSGVVNAVIPCGDPFGLAGYFSVATPA
jgi:hypothetical protein